jgi:hypothetical protein
MYNTFDGILVGQSFDDVKGAILSNILPTMQPVDNNLFVYSCISARSDKKVLPFLQQGQKAVSFLPVSGESSWKAALMTSGTPTKEYVPCSFDDDVDEEDSHAVRHPAPQFGIFLDLLVWVVEKKAEKAAPPQEHTTIIMFQILPLVYKQEKTNNMLLQQQHP